RAVRKRGARARRSLTARLLGGGAGRLLLVALAEALDSSRRVHQLLLAGEEGVALAADLDAQLLLGRAGRPGLAARVVDEDLVILGVQVLLHGTRDYTVIGRIPQPAGVF